MNIPNTMQMKANRRRLSRASEAGAGVAAAPGLIGWALDIEPAAQSCLGAALALVTV